MSAAIPLEDRPIPERITATFGTASLVFAILTIILPVLTVAFFVVLMSVPFLTGADTIGKPSAWASAPAAGEHGGH